MYRADDGSIHETEDLMTAQDAVLRDMRRIECFIESTDSWPRGEAARARRLIGAFMAFEGQRDAD
jgi:hypothetical protein